MAKEQTFTSILDTPASESVRPPALPAGTYTVSTLAGQLIGSYSFTTTSASTANPHSGQGRSP